MSEQVVLSAVLNCNWGTEPAMLLVEPVPGAMVMAEGRPAATIMDSKPLMNIPTFGMCSSLANPTVSVATSAATAAAMGVFTLTPMPCIPAVVAPWVPGAPTVLINGKPALNNLSKCVCTWGGAISIDLSGAVRTMVP